MNARDYKEFRAGGYYHVYNRGNHKADIFCCESDYIAFLWRLKLALGKPIPHGAAGSRVRITPFNHGDFTMLAYCLMPNHYHFLIKQNTDIGIEKFMHRLNTSYAKYYNLKHNKVGNLFQDNFKAKSVADDSYLLHLSAYIHNNPPSPWDYQYSSLPDYLGKRQGSICDTSFLLKMFGDNIAEYETFVRTAGENNASISHLLFNDED